jgi:hypothetical protein
MGNAPGCLVCGSELPSARAFYCSGRCRARAFRRRRAGLPADAYPEGASRGRVPLGRRTLREERAAFLASIGWPAA